MRQRWICLSYLGRRIQHLPVLLLVTYRDDALVTNDPLRLTLGALASQRAIRRLGLPTLSAGRRRDTWRKARESTRPNCTG